MAEYFTGKRETAHFIVELNRGKAAIECTVWEYWLPLINDCVKCGAPVTHNLKQSIGIKATEKTSLENSLQAAIGVKDIAEIKASAKENVSTEICWETITEQTRSVTFTAPKCGRYLALQYQKIRDYHFRFQEKKWFHMNSWQTYMTEHTSCYHDDSKQIDVDPDCNCKMPAPSDYDGLLHVDFGKTSMLVPFRKTDSGIEAIFAGKKVPLESPSNDVFALTIPKASIPEPLRFLGNMSEESYDAVASSFAETEIMSEVEVGKTYEGPVVKMLDFGAIVNVMPGKDGLLHISQISNERINAVTDVLKEGQIVKVKVLEADEKGRLRLSMKALLNAEAATFEEEYPSAESDKTTG